MSACLIVVGVAAYGLVTAPAAINGNYYSSCDTSYCRGVKTYCTPQAPVSSILNKRTGNGYSVTYNYGLQPESVSTYTGSSSYNYGKY